MAKIGLIDVDGHNYPNYALMKIAAFHRAQGDEVMRYDIFAGHCDKVYMSKVFSFTPDYMQPIDADEVIKGGTGYDLRSELPQEIDRLQPDYSLYPQIDERTAYGFLTRGCPNKCYWCVVPHKEGGVHPYMDVDEIAQGGKRPWLILMDNNILAAGEYGMAQLRKIVERGYHVDFNQGLDARLVTPEIAEVLAQIKWIDSIRFGCDNKAQIAECQRAVDMIQSHGCRKNFLFYTMIHGKVEDCYERLTYWAQKGDKFNVQAQPYRDPNNARHVIPQWQKDMAHWANKKQLFHTCDFKDFEPRKGFKCKQYFE